MIYLCFSSFNLWEEFNFLPFSFFLITNFFHSLLKLVQILSHQKMTFIFIRCFCLFYIVANQIVLVFLLLVEKNKHCNNVILGFDESWFSLFLMF